MNDALCMRMRDTVGDLEAVTQDLGCRQSAGGDDVVKRGAAHELHRDVHDRTRFGDVMNGADGRVVQRRGELGFAYQACPGDIVIERAQRQHLQRDIAIQSGVSRTIDLAHSARAERGRNLVGADSCSCGQCHE